MNRCCGAGADRHGHPLNAAKRPIAIWSDRILRTWREWRINLHLLPYQRRGRPHQQLGGSRKDEAELAGLFTGSMVRAPCTWSLEASAQFARLFGSSESRSRTGIRSGWHATHDSRRQPCLDVLGPERRFVRSLHSGGSPLGPNQPDGTWRCTPKTNRFAIFPRRARSGRLVPATGAMHCWGRNATPCALLRCRRATKAGSPSTC